MGSRVSRDFTSRSVEEPLDRGSRGHRALTEDSCSGARLCESVCAQSRTGATEGLLVPVAWRQGWQLHQPLRRTPGSLGPSVFPSTAESSVGPGPFLGRWC